MREREIGRTKFTTSALQLSNKQRILKKRHQTKRQKYTQTNTVLEYSRTCNQFYWMEVFDVINNKDRDFHTDHTIQNGFTRKQEKCKNKFFSSSFVLLCFSYFGKCSTAIARNLSECKNPPKSLQIGQSWQANLLRRCYFRSDKRTFRHTAILTHRTSTYESKTEPSRMWTMYMCI